MLPVIDFTALQPWFPELTPGQFRCAMLYALGTSTPDMAALCGCSVDSVKKYLRGVRLALEVDSLPAVRAVINSRLLCALLTVRKYEA